MTAPDPHELAFARLGIPTEYETLAALMAAHAPTLDERQAATAMATALVAELRQTARPGLMEMFLSTYGLSTSEGVALMCLAEALLRVPDAATVDDLIEDKIGGVSWAEHLGRSDASLVNASTWALMLTGKVLDATSATGVTQALRGLVKRLGEPVIRVAVRAAMKELGSQFVLGETIGAALARGDAAVKQGFTHSFDMLGEAAMTDADAAHYRAAYAGAIAAIGAAAIHDDVRDNAGISIKLSALHPRYEPGQRQRVMDELVPVVRDLARQARAARIGLTIDAEEAMRLELSRDVIGAVLDDPALSGWDGFGVVVQAYGRRAPAVIDWLAARAAADGRRLMVRLVKGAYWDSEIKRAQMEGLADYPVFTRKAMTDVSYLCCAHKLLGFGGLLFPQFATHNAHTMAAILAMAPDRTAFEFQRLHGMGEALHTLVHAREGTRGRIYAPVGAHRDLLAYLVRRLLENGANSSFVNQIQDKSLSAADVAADPFAALERPARHRLALPRAIHAPERDAARGWDIQSDADMAAFAAARAPHLTTAYRAEPLLAGPVAAQPAVAIVNPARPDDVVGLVHDATPEDIATALGAARPWDAAPEVRAAVLRKAAALNEASTGPIAALLGREAGKTIGDAVAELREAVDFLRHYAGQIATLGDRKARGRIVCISPWNFPLAIFTGQVAAALAAGNAVLAKPAEATPLIAHVATTLLHEAGVPRTALQLLPGTGMAVGARLVSDPRVDGVAFTGSTATAQRITRAMAAALAPDAPLVAETGGINAMIVDSTALPEQAVRDIVASAFRSAGQRCSALRVLFVQEEIADTLLAMLRGAMAQLVVGDPLDRATDIGPVISATAQGDIAAYVAAAEGEGRVVARGAVPADGHFVAPTVIRVGGLNEVTREVFGPVLHVATFRAGEIDAVVAAINASGYGLTFGLHSRIDSRVAAVTAALNVGNLYVNRNQIGAVVGVQPFGGEGLSGTGPKAGGPHYLRRFTRPGATRVPAETGLSLQLATLEAALDALGPVPRTPLGAESLVGPTGESNVLRLYPRGRVLCLGPTPQLAAAQAEAARAMGCPALIACPGATGPDALDGWVDRADLARLHGFAAVMLSSDDADLRAARQALAARTGALLPLISDDDAAARLVVERHVCIDTTAAGGNATLLADGR